jgi:hypothetical protein
MALKELMHRKGLNMRFTWILLTKVKLIFARDLIMIDILCRTMRKIVNEETKLKSNSQNLPGTKGFGTENTTNHFIGNNHDSYKETVCFYINAILKNKFCKYR